jgi:CDP-Glycerol:Poly(glycerophosphate) glycerophosphotransferase
VDDVLTPLRRRAVSLARRLDFAAGRTLCPLRVLVDARTPMNLTVLAPVWRELVADARLDVRFTGTDREDVSRAFAQSGVAGRVVARPAARLQRWDLYVNADPWDPAPLLRCRRRVNFFHGAAGKYDLECPIGLPLDLGIYDRIAFPNAGRMQRYVSAGLARSEQAALIGFPKLDALVNRRVPRRAVAAVLGLDTGAPTAIYAPTFSPQSSLQEHGEPIVRALLEGGLNVIVKLHDRSLDPDPKYSGGHDWRRRFDRFSETGRFLFATNPDSTDYLAASDVLITDHSTIGFEFCALDRPLIVFDVPDLLIAARIDPARVRLLRTAARVVSNVSELRSAVDRALERPEDRRAERLTAVSEVFYDPGRATERACGLCYGLLECPIAGATRVRSMAG